MKIIFMGTPDFAVPTLEAVAAAGHEVCLAVTQPDRPKGRRGEPAFSPAKEAALRLGIPVFQPEKVRTAESIEYLETFRPDVIVVVAFGQILPQKLLDIPKYGCINGHASLLPMYRGAAPIQWVILRGEKETGITTMYMDAGLDTGDMIFREKVEIAPDETGGSLHDKLSEVGARLMVKTLSAVEAGTAPRTAQEGDTFYAKMLTKEMGEIDWSQDAVVIERQIRALSPWPSAYTHLKGKTLKIWQARVLAEYTGSPCGTVVKVGKTSFTVAAGSGALEILSLQMEGKKRMDTESFLRGFSLTEGEKLCQSCTK